LVTLFKRILGPRVDADAFAPLYAAIVAEARRPHWYRDGAVPDTIDGRFDMVSTVLALVLLRLEALGEPARESSARVTELFISDMDGQLRQRGIGDLVVGKHIGRMMSQVGGRLGALRDAFAGGDLDGAIDRNIYRGAVPGEAARAAVRERLTSLRARLAAMPAAELVAGGWPA